MKQLMTMSYRTIFDYNGWISNIIQNNVPINY